MGTACLWNRHAGLSPSYAAGGIEIEYVDRCSKYVGSVHTNAKPYEGRPVFNDLLLLLASGSAGGMQSMALCTSNALHPVVWPDKFHLHRPHAVEAYMVEHAVGIAANQCELKLLLVECDSWLLCMRGRGRQG